ncbi:hypothetical protein KKE60_05855, partial [Patescibacteria group bacterium]|nr:hypothetical protein [Patescibacteria group bacterium]
GAGAIYPSAFSTLDQTFSNTIDAAKIDMWQSQQASAFGFNKISDLFGQGYATAANTLNLLPSGPAPGFTGDEGWFRTAIGAAGIGYDPKSILSRGDYQKAMQRRMAYTAPDAFGAILGGTIGFAAGSAISAGALGVIGGVVGGFVGEKVIGGGLNLLYGDVIQDMQTADYVNYNLLETLGGKNISPDFGTTVATRMREFTKSRGAIQDKIDRGEAEELFSQFTVMGGFATTRTADEYLQRFDDMLEGHRKVMHALRVSSEKALQFMATLESTNLIGTAPGQFVSYDFAAQMMRAVGTSVGLPVGTVVNYGLQSQQLATQAIPDISFSAALGGGIATLMHTQQLAQAGLYDNEMLAHLGGVTGIATVLQGAAYNYAKTPMGRMTLLAGPGNADMSIMGKLSGGMGNINSIADMIRFQTGMDMANQFEQFGPNRMLTSSVYDVVGVMDLLGVEKEVGGKYDLDATAGMFMLMYPGTTQDQARAAVIGAGNRGMSRAEMESELVTNLLKQGLAEQPTGFQEAVTTIKQGYGSLRESVLKPLLVAGVVGTGASAATWAGALGTAAALGTPVGVTVGVLAAAASLVYPIFRGPEGRSRDYQKVMKDISGLMGNTIRDIDVDILDIMEKMKPEEQKKIRDDAREMREEILESYADNPLNISFFGKNVPSENKIILDTIEKRQEHAVDVLRTELKTMGEDPVKREVLENLGINFKNDENLIKNLLEGDIKDKTLEKKIISYLGEGKLTPESFKRLRKQYQAGSFLEASANALEESPAFLKELGFTETLETPEDLRRFAQNIVAGKYKAGDDELVRKAFLDYYDDKTKPEAVKALTEMLTMNALNKGKGARETITQFTQIQSLLGKYGIENDFETEYILERVSTTKQGIMTPDKLERQEEEVRLAAFLSRAGGGDAAVKATAQYLAAARSSKDGALHVIAHEAE